MYGSATGIPAGLTSEAKTEATGSAILQWARVLPQNSTEANNTNGAIIRCFMFWNIMS
jgi:hypothetical protein